MGQMGYVGWAVLMASAILFSSLLGIVLGEWRGTSTRTRSLLGAGLVLLILSSAVVGLSGYLAEKEKSQLPAAAPKTAANPVQSVSRSVALFAELQPVPFRCGYSGAPAIGPMRIRIYT